jgi:hypothetical protein
MSSCGSVPPDSMVRTLFKMVMNNTNPEAVHLSLWQGHMADRLKCFLVAVLLQVLLC